mmetsp:Transcript_31921/g.67599  ORF Transcript_31921/g.67599 Transcript_31921/m.67599 type:complete len:211 (+) Transcript_31921:2674-3306(+)
MHPFWKRPPPPLSIIAYWQNSCVNLVFPTPPTPHTMTASHFLDIERRYISLRRANSSSLPNSIVSLSSICSPVLQAKSKSRSWRYTPGDSIIVSKSIFTSAMLLYASSSLKSPLQLPIMLPIKSQRMIGSPSDLNCSANEECACNRQDFCLPSFILPSVRDLGLLSELRGSTPSSQLLLELPKSSSSSPSSSSIFIAVNRSDFPVEVWCD